MANVQKYFEDFHEEIKLKRFEENATLREKRDIIRSKLHNCLSEIFEKYGEKCPAFDFCDQGSYDLDTGIKPLDCDFDIDQGLYFEIGVADYPDPVLLKKRVYEALEGYTDNVRIRMPCVTVFYHLDSEPIYHVDIAIYTDGSKDADGKKRLARGKINSQEEYRIWEVSDQAGLRQAIFNRFDTNGYNQFRRIVRYLKRWKDENFVSDGHAAPRGIALTIAAYYYLQPTYSDIISAKPYDLKALRDLVNTLLGRFFPQWDETEKKYIPRLTIKLPVEPENDLLEKLTAKQMQNLKDQLKDLRTALDKAESEVDPVEACQELKKVFGSYFPVPTKEETGKKYSPAIISSSSSA